MNYKDTINYLYSRMPMFERQGASGYKEGLSNTLVLDEHFKHPHHSFSTIHVGGTNGKGSVSHMLAAVLQQQGYKVGLYTSPHLVDFRERIRINGAPINKQYVIDFVEHERNFFEPLYPSFFEVTTALAFKYFRDMGVDIAVVEVGLGGRLDCTNIITPKVAVITNISYDHTQFLGDTLAKIAGEKAGIIKKDVPVIIGENHPETRPVFESQAKSVGAPIIFAEDSQEVVNTTLLPGGIHYETHHYGTLDCDLGGLYQPKNLNTVLHVIEVMRKNGILKDAELNATISKALCQVTTMTGLMGRWQTVAQHPTVVCDTGHNLGGWQYISQQLALIECQQMHIVFGMVDDKDINGVMALLPKGAKYYFTRASSKRAIDENTVRLIAGLHGLHGDPYPTVNEAYKTARSNACADDFIFIGGSSYVVGDFLGECL